MRTLSSFLFMAGFFGLLTIDTTKEVGHCLILFTIYITVMAIASILFDVFDKRAEKNNH